jgi:dihydropteroate synthase type 2
MIFGILNITDDSFSDGGKYLAPEAAIAHGRKLIADGADVIDIGAASSNPESKGVAPELEIERLAPVIAALQREGVKLSIDTFAPEVQRWALAQGVDYLNDIQGFPESSLYSSLAGSRAKLIVMHSVQERGPATRVSWEVDQVFDHCLRFFEARLAALTKAGIARERLILDPGMGFFLGANAEASFAMLRRLPQLRRAFDLPLLVSVSRKSFLRRLTGRGVRELGAATLAAELFALSQGADHIRTHEPAPLKDGRAVWQALSGKEP